MVLLQKVAVCCVWSGWRCQMIIIIKCTSCNQTINATIIIKQSSIRTAKNKLLLNNNHGGVGMWEYSQPHPLFHLKILKSEFSLHWSSHLPEAVKATLLYGSAKQQPMPFKVKRAVWEWLGFADWDVSVGKVMQRSWKSIQTAKVLISDCPILVIIIKLSLWICHVLQLPFLVSCNARQVTETTILISIMCNCHQWVMPKISQTSAMKQT